MKIYPYLACLVLLASCSVNKYTATNKIYKKQAAGYAETIRSFPPVNQAIDSLSPDQQSWVGSINFGIRKPNYVVIHHTAQDSLQQTINTFIVKGRSEVSSHYVVGRKGEVVQMVNDYLRAHHAGIGKWGNDKDLNSSSIGIEIDNNGKEPYSAVQLKSLMTLLATLKKRYNIPAANFIGHADVAPGRKNDPRNFPWKVFAKKGFGLWYDDVLLLPPPDFDAVAALRIIGYDVKNLPAAIEAFKIHFVQTDITQVLTPADKLILFNLYKKYM
ncbi:N-acetylmuramoyl-L-alanine amidase [Pedobacter metabolipauper]|uniref:N-acetylmuramoyl-L-alanine amidase n=1 Tax=Pedobacter metabolipauper TaxID=425513 RepID=A0A4R6SV30_9SPHI|nr:N-acetylmuramoyl-L-alanine amidase [Pedobacter metabolipauper]TDQ09630.1 N-acetylmuramoyl-L-alanine amidase [Pedobacter metabolipauper]